MADRDVDKFHSVLVFGVNLLSQYLEIRTSDYRGNREQEQKKHIVYMENLATLEAETMYIKKTVTYLESIDRSSFSNPEEYMQYVLSSLEKYYHDNGIPSICKVVMEEKIDNCWKFFCNFYKET
jgi:hypothetical protein